MDQALAQDLVPWPERAGVCENLRMPGSGDGSAHARVESARPVAPPPEGVAASDVDGALRDLVAQGQLRRAVTQLMERHGDAVFSFALRVVRDEELARDVLQQTFLEAHRDLPGFEGRSSLKTWLLSIANHRALDAVRARRRSSRRLIEGAAMAERPDEDAPSVPALLDGPREARALEECLAELAPEVRVALLMRFSQGLQFREIARVTGERTGTLHARVTRAMPVLRRCLESKGIEP